MTSTIPLSDPGIEWHESVLCTRHYTTLPAPRTAKGVRAFATAGAVSGWVDMAPARAREGEGWCRHSACIPLETQPSGDTNGVGTRFYATINVEWRRHEASEPLCGERPCPSLVQIIKDLITKILTRALEPVIRGIQDWADNVNSKIKYHFGEWLGADDPPFDAHQAAKDIWDALTSGYVFGGIMAVCLAITAILTIANPLSFAITGGTTNVLIGEIAKLAIQQIIAGILITLTVGAIAATTAVGILYLLKPESDPFWKEGIGLAIFSCVDTLGGIIMNWMVTLHLGCSDALMLVLSILSLVCGVVQQNIVSAVFGLILSGISLAMVLAFDDAFDILGMPICWVEEIIASIVFFYSEANALEYF